MQCINAHVEGLRVGAAACCVVLTTHAWSLSLLSTSNAPCEADRRLGVKGGRTHIGIYSQGYSTQRLQSLTLVQSVAWAGVTADPAASTKVNVTVRAIIVLYRLAD